MQRPTAARPSRFDNGHSAWSHPAVTLPVFDSDIERLGASVPVSRRTEPKNMQTSRTRTVARKPLDRHHLRPREGRRCDRNDPHRHAFPLRLIRDSVVTRETADLVGGASEHVVTVGMAGSHRGHIFKFNFATFLAIACYPDAPTREPLRRASASAMLCPASYALNSPVRFGM
jgi:hypothetical protein